MELSQDSPKFAGEDDCRKRWDSFADDRPEGQRLTIATYIAKAKETGWVQRARGGSGGPTKPDAASILLELIEDAGDEHFLDKDGVPYVRYRRSTGSDTTGPRLTARLDSERYALHLGRRFHQHTIVQTLPKEQLKNALGLLYAEAIERDARRDIGLRVAAHGGRIYVNLERGDGRAIEIDGDGWRVVSDPPVLFVSGSRGRLPIPEPGGTLDDLKRHLPNLDREGVQTVLAFAIGAFNLQGSYPLLLFNGGHGTAKSTMADMVVALVDPPNGRHDARFGLAADERDLVIHASGARVLYFDNVSSFGPREADRLCKMLSGTAFSTRSLYSDTGEQRFMMRRPIIATCIGTPSSRGDLLDRMISVEAQSRSARRTEDDVWADFDRDWPKLFGLVLTGVSLAIRNRDAVRAAVKTGEIIAPRLADFAIFVEGASELLGLKRGAFCAMLRGEQSRQQAEAAAGDPVGAALIKHFEAYPDDVIETTAAGLLDMLAKGDWNRERGWPSKNKVRSQLERIRPGLAALGIEITIIKAGGKANVLQFNIRTTAAFRPVDARSDPF